MKFVTKCYVVSSLEVGSSDFCRFALHSYYLKNEDDMKLAASIVESFLRVSMYVCCVAGKKGSSAKGGRKGNTDLRKGGGKVTPTIYSSHKYVLLM